MKILRHGGIVVSGHVEWDYTFVVPRWDADGRASKRILITTKSVPLARRYGAGIDDRVDRSTDVRWTGVMQNPRSETTVITERFKLPNRSFVRFVSENWSQTMETM
jgi:hypothetical protein